MDGIKIVYMDRSSSRFQETADEPNKCRFTTSIRAAYEKEFAIRNREVDAFQSTGSVRIMMVKISDLDHIEYESLTTCLLKMGRIARARMRTTEALIASPMRKGSTPTINAFVHDIGATILSQGTPSA